MVPSRAQRSTPMIRIRIPRTFPEARKRERRNKKKREMARGKNSSRLAIKSRLCFSLHPSSPQCSVVATVLDKSQRGWWNRLQAMYHPSCPQVLIAALCSISTFSWSSMHHGCWDCCVLWPLPLALALPSHCAVPVLGPCDRCSTHCMHLAISTARHGSHGERTWHAK